VQTAADVAAQRREIDRIARSLDHASVLTLDTAASAVTQQLEDGRIVHPVAELVRPLGPHSWRGIAPVYVAGPELLASAGINPSDIPADTDVLTAQRGPVAIGAGDVFAGNTGASAGEKTRASSIRIRVANIKAPAHTSVPQAFITTAGMNRLGLKPLTVGWLIESAKPLTNAQLSTARDAAARAGLTVEARDTQRGLGTTRTAATIAGMLLALAILAMTVGLIRSEAGRDLRTLTATGATSNTRRMITAVTAGALALLGVVLGALAAYLALIAGYLHDLDPLKHVPLTHLMVMVLGLPLLATAAGWLVSGREPAAVARTALD
jgi:putative ABC transport system permease protein